MMYKLKKKGMAFPMKYEKVRDDSQMRALTGLMLWQFEGLSSKFQVEYQERQEQRYLGGVATGTCHCFS